MKSLYEAFNAPIHFNLSQLDGKRSLSFHLYPIVLLLVAGLLFIIISVAIITALATDKQTMFSQQSQTSELQQQLERLQQKNTETEVFLSLRDAQVDTMKQEVERLQHERSAMQKRLEMFDEVLAARKVKGVHMLRPSAQWKNNNLISYSLILVKGENYPRWRKGTLQFSVKTPEGKVLQLQNPKGKSSHKFEMTTQAFITGSLAWSEPWKPETLIITMFTEKGKQTGEVTVPILNHALIDTDATKEEPND